jgi:hypothetical protein
MEISGTTFSVLTVVSFVVLRLNVADPGCQFAESPAGSCRFQIAKYLVSQGKVSLLDAHAAAQAADGKAALPAADGCSLGGKDAAAEPSPAGGGAGPFSALEEFTSQRLL